jgi:hypothetical protein
MSYFAKVVDNKVVKVIAAKQDFIDQYDDGLGGEWIQTSYNSRGGKHYDRNGVEDDNPHLRYNYAGGGFTYDRENDAFIPPKPFLSFVLNETTFRYEPPIPYPVGMPGGPRRYIWNEEYYQAEGKWYDLWATEDALANFNPESKYYDSTAKPPIPFASEKQQEW